jgi:GAF domain-containing protein
MQSVVNVPLVARGRILGALSFVAAESGRRFGPGDLPVVEDLARRAALAVDNARLYADA